ncbi:hypothetical protein V6N13_113566 [Hibiscus sabdariffa]
MQKAANTSAPLQNYSSRFNPIIASDIDEEVAFSAGTKAAHTVSPHHDRKSLNPSSLKASGKKKVVSSGKASRVSPMRKPLQVNLSDFPVLSRFSAKASSSRSKPLDTTRHSTTIMKENADPNIVNLPRVSDTSSRFTSSDATMVMAEGSFVGDPPDRSAQAAGGQFADRSLSIPGTGSPDIVTDVNSHNAEGDRVMAMLE